MTRARAQASGLAQRLEALGADVIQAPAIRVRGSLIRITRRSTRTPYDLICVTSANGVAGLFERLDDGTHPRGDARALAGTRIAAIGAATARALAERGIVADVLPERSVAESLVRGARRGAGAARADRAGTRGARRAPRRAAGTRRRGGHPRAVRDRRRAARSRGPAGRARGRLRDLHLVLDRALPAAGGRRRRRALTRHAARVDRPGDERGAARARASSRISRPIRTTSRV